MSYRDLEIWQLARELSIAVHRMSIEKLPKFELHEEGSQIRRAIKSVRTNMVEGYGRRRYKQEFIHFLVIAIGSCDETMDHLEGLFETGSLTDAELYHQLHEKLTTLGKKLHCFLQAVETQHQSMHEEPAIYSTTNEAQSE